MDTPDPMDTSKPSKRPPCTATSRQTGKRCKNQPIPGGTVCRFHGGAAPQVKLAARLRLAALVDPALGVLEAFLSPAPPIEGQPAPVALDAELLFRIAKDVLDRNGHKAPTKIQVQRVIDPAKLNDADLASAISLSRKILGLPAASPGDDDAEAAE